jgi:DUF438 domain-containing protein
MALREDLTALARIALHYSKKENLFFPFLEQYGITAPPQVMWGVDDEIREALRDIRSSLDSLEDRRQVLREKLETLLTRIDEMVFKEENILFPMMMETLKPADWGVVASGIGEIGFFLIDGAPEWHPAGLVQVTPPAPVEASAAPDARIQMPSGQMSLEELTRVLDTLPLDITFVDADDTVRYFSQGSDRIFARTLSVLGRKVSNCHPPKSVHIVEQIVAISNPAARTTKTSGSGWASEWSISAICGPLPPGDYLGTLEVTQDIAPILELEGRKAADVLNRPLRPPLPQFSAVHPQDRKQ